MFSFWLLQGFRRGNKLKPNGYPLLLWERPERIGWSVRNAFRKKDGRVVFVEFRKEDPDVPIQPLHKMSVEQVRKEIEPLGFKFQKSLEFLPWQHIIIFGR